MALAPPPFHSFCTTDFSRMVNWLGRQDVTEWSRIINSQDKWQASIYFKNSHFKLVFVYYFLSVVGLSFNNVKYLKQICVPQHEVVWVMRRGKGELRHFGDWYNWDVTWKYIDWVHQYHNLYHWSDLYSDGVKKVSHGWGAVEFSR